MKQTIFLGLVILVASAQVQASEEEKGKADASAHVAVQQQQQASPMRDRDIEAEFRSPELSDESLANLIMQLSPNPNRSNPAQAEQNQQNQ